jgi:hypothetical protein
MLNPTHRLDGNSNSTLLPNLLTFSCQETELDLGIIVDMLKSLWKPGVTSNENVFQRLQSDIDHGGHQYTNDTVGMSLRQLAEDGMNLAGSFLKIPPAE